MADSYPQETKPRRRWGRRLLILVLVLVVLLGIGLFVVDRLGASFAERMIAEKVAQQVAANGATSAEPEVTIGGGLFVTQVLDGNYRDIKILLRDFSGTSGSGKVVKVPQLDIRAKDVRAPLSAIRSGNGQIIATTVSGVGTLDYASLAGLIDHQGVSLRENGGKLTVQGPIEALGRTFNITGTANLTVKGDVVQVRFAQVTADGLTGVPFVQDLLNSYAKDISIDLKLPTLPLRLAIQKVEPKPEGLVVTATAAEVPLNSSGR